MCVAEQSSATCVKGERSSSRAVWKSSSMQIIGARQVVLFGRTRQVGRWKSSSISITGARRVELFRRIPSV